MSALVACPFCDGKGHKAEVPCDVCHGVGRTPSAPAAAPTPTTAAVYPPGLRELVVDPFLGRSTVRVDAAVLEEIFALADGLPTGAWLEMMGHRLRDVDAADKHGGKVRLADVLEGVAELDRLIERLNYRARQGRRAADEKRRADYPVLVSAAWGRRP